MQVLRIITSILQNSGNLLIMEIVVNSLSIPPHHQGWLGRPPTDQDWEDHRRIITELYIQEGRKLSDVIEFMGRERGFFATYVSLLFSLSLTTLWKS